MKFLKHLPVLFVVFGLFTISSCQHDIDVYVPDNNNVGQILNPSPVQASVSGEVIDENDQVVAGATVTSGTHTTTTDSRGLFRFNNIEMDKYASVVTVEFNGYFKGIRTFSATQGSSGFIKIKLTQKALIGTVDASAGGAVTLPDNSIITLLGNSVVVKSTGLPYTGNINVYAANIDPTANDISVTIPGSFQATDANNFRVLLKSYGMLAVQLEGQSGELLQISTGKTAKLRFTIPASLSSAAPSTIPLWSLNEADGLWKQEGNATKTANYYEGDVTHFSFWNCDVGANTIYLELTLATADGPLPNAVVRITRSNGFSSYGVTDSAGHVGGLVFSNETMTLEVLNVCWDPIYSQSIGPFTQYTNLGTITVTIPPLFTLSITGNATDCNSVPITSGNAMIYWEGQLITTPINNGSFSVSITRCNGTTADAEIFVTDNTTQQQSTTWTGSAASGIINTGTLNACSVSTEQYINYSVNGIDYSLVAPTDFIIQYNMQGISGIQGSGTADSVYFSMDYSGIGVGSSQAIQAFNSSHMIPAMSYSFNPPMFASITEYGSIGEFIAGSFSGTIITNTPINTYNITCSFRVRRTF